METKRTLFWLLLANGYACVYAGNFVLRDHCMCCCKELCGTAGLHCPLVAVLILFLYCCEKEEQDLGL